MNRAVFALHRTLCSSHRTRPVSRSRVQLALLLRSVSVRSSTCSRVQFSHASVRSVFSVRSGASAPVRCSARASGHPRLVSGAARLQKAPDASGQGFSSVSSRFEPAFVPLVCSAGALQKLCVSLWIFVRFSGRCPETRSAVASSRSARPSLSCPSARGTFFSSVVLRFGLDRARLPPPRAADRRDLLCSRPHPILFLLHHSLVAPPAAQPPPGNRAPAARVEH